MKWFLLFVAFAFSSHAWAEAWSKPTLGCPNAARFEFSSWTETGTADSGLLVSVCPVTIKNTGSEPWTLWDASCETGLATNIWWTTTDGGDCSDTMADDCGKTEAPAGCYIIVPDATGASAEAVPTVGQ